MKSFTKFVVFAVLTLALMSSAAVAFAQSGDGQSRGPGGRGIGGEVIAIDGNTITVENPRGTGTIATNGDTQFTINGESGSLSDIQVGMFAGAKGEISEDGTSVTAEQVFAGNERPERDGRKGGRGIGGEVTAIEGKTITVENPRGTGTIITGGDTQFTVNGEDGSLADIQVGMFAGAKGEMSEDGTSVTAEQVFAGDERPERNGHKGGRGIGGEVTAIDGNTITVENPRGTGTIITTGDTQFTVNGVDGGLSDIQVGMFVGAKGEMSEDSSSVTATDVFAGDERPQRNSHGQGQRPGRGGQA